MLAAAAAAALVGVVDDDDAVIAGDNKPKVACIFFPSDKRMRSTLPSFYRFNSHPIKHIPKFHTIWMDFGTIYRPLTLTQCVPDGVYHLSRKSLSIHNN